MTSAAEHFAGQRHFIGTITPSGNTVVERITLGVLHALPQVSAHFSRIPVFGSTDPSPDAYAMPGMLAAAELLAHAAPQVLVWNGSKGQGIGFRHDRALVDAIQTATGIRDHDIDPGACSAAAGQGHRPHRCRHARMPTPGRQRPCNAWRDEGLQVLAHACSGLSDNLSYASVPPQQIAAMARTVAQSRPQAIVCLCTNFPAAVMAAPLEAELGLPVYDSTALGVWHALQLCGADSRAAAPLWGSLFRERI